jgi:hypothetical protein
MNDVDPVTSVAGKLALDTDADTANCSPTPTCPGVVTVNDAASRHDTFTDGGRPPVFTLTVPPGA